MMPRAEVIIQNLHLRAVVPHRLQQLPRRVVEHTSHENHMHVVEEGVPGGASQVEQAVVLDQGTPHQIPPEPRLQLAKGGLGESGVRCRSIPESPQDCSDRPRSVELQLGRLSARMVPGHPCRIGLHHLAVHGTAVYRGGLLVV